MAKTNMEKLRTADWDQLERDVVFRIRLLRATCEKLEPGAVSDKIAQDIFLPALGLLAEFCACVEIGEPDDDEDDNAPTSPN